MSAACYQQSNASEKYYKNVNKKNVENAYDQEKEILQTQGLPAWKAASIIPDKSSKTKISFLAAVLV